MNSRIGIVWLGCLACVMLCMSQPVYAAADNRITEFAQRCQEAGWDSATIDKLEGLLADGVGSGLDMDILSLRLQEGLAKKADPATVVQAVGSRLGVMKQARTLAEAHDCPSAQLEQAVGFALEAGMSTETIGSILANGNKQRAGQLVALVDAGRTLVASGWEEKAALGLTTDFQERNLRRSEMIRAVRTLSEMGPSTADQLPMVRARLWGGQHGAPDGGAPTGAQQGPGQGLGAGGISSGSRRGGRGEPGSGAHQ